jgi:long-chain fatty acid transport protein
VNIGLANTSIKNLSLGLDLVWTEWSTYDALIITTPAGSGGLPKNWENVISIRFGGEYALGESWALRAGYVWDESPVPDETRAPDLPGSDRQMLMAGVGWKRAGLGIDAAYSYPWADKANMGTNYPLPGEFETTAHFVSVSVSYTF